MKLSASTICLYESFDMNYLDCGEFPVGFKLFPCLFQDEDTRQATNVGDNLVFHSLINSFNYFLQNNSDDILNLGMGW